MGMRELFGRLLYPSTVEKIDMEKVFRYPLIPVPLSLAHLGGTINYYTKLRRWLRQSYGKIAEDILRKLCCMATRVDFVCDTYHDASIKEIERNRRGAAEMTFAITGPDQKRPRD